MAKAKKPAMGPINLVVPKGKTEAQATAELFLDSPSLNAITASRFVDGNAGAIDLNAAIGVLKERAERAKKGDLSDGEAMLAAQATALDVIFTEMARRAHLNMGTYIDAADTYLRLALKAQSQCRTTVETLAEIKNPRAVAFVRQANIAHGHQQVNNAAGPPDAARAGKTTVQPNRLMEGGDGEWLDTGTAGIAGEANSRLAPVGAVNRAED